MDDDARQETVVLQHSQHRKGGSLFLWNHLVWQVSDSFPLSTGRNLEQDQTDMTGLARRVTAQHILVSFVCFPQSCPTQQEPEVSWCCQGQRFLTVALNIAFNIQVRVEDGMSEPQQLSGQF